MSSERIEEGEGKKKMVGIEEGEEHLKRKREEKSEEKRGES